MSFHENRKYGSTTRSTIQDAERARNELAKTQAEAAKEIAAAEGDAKATVTRAQGEAEANRIRQSPLTPQLLEHPLGRGEGSIVFAGEIALNDRQLDLLGLI